MIIHKDIKGENSCMKCAFKNETRCISKATELGLPYCIDESCYFENEEHSPENLDPERKVFNTEEL